MSGLHLQSPTGLHLVADASRLFVTFDVRHKMSYVSNTQCYFRIVVIAAFFGLDINS